MTPQAVQYTYFITSDKTIMLQRILKKLAGDYNAQQLNRFTPLLEKTNKIYQELDELSDQEIRNKTKYFQEEIQKNGKSLDDILPEAFAVVKQACRRMMGTTVEVKGENLERNMIPYDVQILGGIALHKGIIAEMKTGEGKTLVATLPAYLNALTGKGVHIVTVNDYLASRDAEWMGHLYNRLGLSVGVVVKGIPIHQRREQYEKDITYVENSELGFDYLRDNLVRSNSEKNLTFKTLNYAIVDEIDSILIDEARTPLIISQPAEAATEKYGYYAHVVQSLIPCKTKKKVSKGLLHELVNKDKKDEEKDDGDYYIDEKSKTALLSSNGIAKLENLLKVENLYQDIGYEEIHHIENALKAQALFHKDKEYIVRENEILIVDEHTGRAMPGRRFSEGLHQAIEAKEGVLVQRESKTMASITYQNFFKQYEKLAGMTGTALTEGEEFMKIYNLDVLEMPTNKDVIRVDKNDKVYFNQKAKRKSVKEYIKWYHSMGQPILIGTSSIKTSEYVSNILNKENIVHAVLNAKQHEREADIVSNAGKPGSVMVATNMAGRGTDIKLEKELNNKIADNYIRWINSQISQDKPNTISAVLYSSIEYELTINALQSSRKLNEEQINQAITGELKHEKGILKIKFNRSKKINTDAFVEIIFKPTENHQSSEIVYKDLHYGLFILGTEKHDSRRIDNQLRGRAGRQGDPGFSVFFVALDDEIMRKMGGEQIQSVAKMMIKQDELEDMELNQSQFSNAIIRAQKQMESMHFSIRKHLFDYDSIIDKQRQRIYGKRNDILSSEENETTQKDFVKNTLKELEQYVDEVITQQINNAQNIQQSAQDLLNIISKELNITFSDKQIEKLTAMSDKELDQELSSYIYKQIIKKWKGIDESRLYNIFKEIYLHHLDKLWIEHIDQMQYLREKVALMGYAQQDPLTIYKQQAYEKFQNLLYMFKFETVSSITRIDFDQVQNQAQLQITNNKTSKDEYLKALQQVAGSEELQEMVKDIQNESSKPKVFEHDGEFEVFEVEDKSTISNNNTNDNKNDVIDTNTKKKLRPNDTVSVRYQDGKILKDVKYKKVKDDVESGNCVVV